MLKKINALGGSKYMSNLSDNDIREYFRAGSMGFWKFELENGKPPRLYADAVANSLFGTSEDMPPEERAVFLIAHVHPDEQELFNEYFTGLLEKESEIIYRYIHPVSGEMYVRCTGRCISRSDNVTSIVGYHSKITDIMRLEPNKLLENKLERTNRDLQKEQLRQNDYHKELMDMVSCGILSYTLPEHRILYMNAEALRIYGMSCIEEAQAYLKDIFKDITYIDPKVPLLLRKLCHEKDTLDFECIITNGKGERTNVLAKSEVFVTPQGETSVVTTFIDISENVTLKNEKSILEALCTEYTAVYFCDLTTDTMTNLKCDSDHCSFETLSDPKDRMRGFTYRMARFYDRFVIKESAPDFTEKMNAKYIMDFLSHNKRFIYRYRSKPDLLGNEHFEVQAVRLNTEGGFKVVIGFRYIDDILHEQERQKEQLETALAQAQFNNDIIGAISKIYWGIYHLDLEKGIYQEISSEIGLHKFKDKEKSIAEALARSNRDIVAPEFRAPLKVFNDLSTLPDRLKKHESVSIDICTTSGAWYLLRYIAKNRDSSGKVTSVLFVVLENNEEKNKELEYQRQLLLTAEDAKRANIAKTDFLRRMSHDIRTPINGIIGMLSIAEHYPDDLEKQSECRAKIKQVSGFLLELINNILDMNKLESGKLVLEHKPFDLMDILDEVNNLTDINAQEYGLTLYTDNSGLNHTHLIGSPLHLRQILQNLAGNAVKYNRAGGSISVSCRELSCKDGKAGLQFVCEDTGIGMSEEFQKHAFETFTQETSRSRSTYTGTGLGLAITKQLTELMGGTITLESKLGVGTKFTVDLAFDIDENYVKTPADETNRCENSLSGVRILIAEDNDINMEIARFMLEKNGAVITEAWNGREAADIFAASKPNSFDIILMDVMMPIMDGLTASREIRSLDREDAKKIPIFAMTANAFQEDIRQSRDAGMNEHFSKPLNERELLGAICRYMNK